MKFAQVLAKEIKSADPTATSDLRDGPMPEGFSLDNLGGVLEPPAHV